MNRWTVIGVYVDNDQRFCFPVAAGSADEAEAIIRRRLKEPLIVAGVVAGEHVSQESAIYGNEMAPT